MSGFMKTTLILFSIVLAVIGCFLFYEHKKIEQRNLALDTLLAEKAKHDKQLILDKQMTDDDKKRVLVNSLREGNVEIVELILKDTKLDPNMPGDYMLLVEGAMAKENGPELLSLLIEAGLKNLNIADSDGFTLLHWTAIEDCADSAEYLIKKGIRIDIKDSFYIETPLHVCAKRGSPKMAKLLLEHGADVFAKDKLGNRPLDLALEPTNPDLASASGKRKVAALLRQYMEKSKQSN